MRLAVVRDATRTAASPDAAFRSLYTGCAC